jgi:hypothetical protein
MGSDAAQRLGSGVVFISIAAIGVIVARRTLHIGCILGFVKNTLLYGLVAAGGNARGVRMALLRIYLRACLLGDYNGRPDGTCDIHHQSPFWTISILL